MTSFKLLILLTLFAGCTTQKDTPFTRVKAEHDKRLVALQNSPEPFDSKIADSMKRWIPIFKTVYVNDQKNRYVGYGFTKAGLKEQQALDAENVKIVSAYIDQYGWPALTDIGFIGQRAVGMTIQHAPLSIQDKYYPALVNAYKRDTLLFETLALLEDRINMHHHRYQYYGTQLTSYQGKLVLYPVYNVDSLDIRRAQLGFKMPMADYLNLLRAGWESYAYKSMLPELVKAFKVSDTLGVHYSRY